MAVRPKTSGPKPVCGRGPRQGRAASARRQAQAAEARRGRRAGSSARAGRRAHAHAGRRVRSVRWCSGDRPAPARPRWRGCWRRRPTCISSRFPRSLPASPTSRRCSRKRVTAAKWGRARCCSSTRSIASTAPSRTVSCPVMEDGTIILVGATTENPSFELNAPLLVARARAGLQISRCRSNREAARACREDRKQAAAARCRCA